MEKLLADLKKLQEKLSQDRETILRWQNRYPAGLKGGALIAEYLRELKAPGPDVLFALLDNNPSLYLLVK